MKKKQKESTTLLFGCFINEMEIPKWLSKKDREKAKEVGGIDERDFAPIETNLPYCDKTDHRKRSLFWQPQHRKHKFDQPLDNGDNRGNGADMGQATQGA